VAKIVSHAIDSSILLACLLIFGACQAAGSDPAQNVLEVTFQTDDPALFRTDQNSLVLPRATALVVADLRNDQLEFEPRHIETAYEFLPGGILLNSIPPGAGYSLSLEFRDSAGIALVRGERKNFFVQGGIGNSVSVNLVRLNAAVQMQFQAASTELSGRVGDFQMVAKLFDASQHLLASQTSTLNNLANRSIRFETVGTGSDLTGQLEIHQQIDGLWLLIARTMISFAVDASQSEIRIPMITDIFLLAAEVVCSDPIPFFDDVASQVNIADYLLSISPVDKKDEPIIIHSAQAKIQLTGIVVGKYRLQASVRDSHGQEIARSDVWPVFFSEDSPDAFWLPLALRPATLTIRLPDPLPAWLISADTWKIEIAAGQAQVLQFEFPTQGSIPPLTDIPPIANGQLTVRALQAGSAIGQASQSIALLPGDPVEAQLVFEQAFRAKPAKETP
jgi:hypothetical protein